MGDVDRKATRELANALPGMTHGVRIDIGVARRARSDVNSVAIQVRGRVSE